MTMLLLNQVLSVSIMLILEVNISKYFLSFLSIFIHAGMDLQNDAIEIKFWKRSNRQIKSVLFISPPPQQSPASWGRLGRDANWGFQTKSF